MRYRVTFLTGLAIGFLVGARAGRERYDQIVKLTRQAAASPQAKQVTQTITDKGTEFSKMAAANVPKLVKKARRTAGDRFDHFPVIGGHAHTPDPASVDGARSPADSP
jgi:gas vesicle protein